MKFTNEELLEKVNILRQIRTTGNQLAIDTKWTDSEIIEQLRTFFESTQRSSHEVTKHYNDFLRRIPLDMTVEEVKMAVQLEMYNFFGWINLTPMDMTFWSNMGRVNYANLAVLIEPTSQNYFSNIYNYGSTLYHILTHGVEPLYKKFVEIRNLRDTVHTSIYNNMDEMEEELSVKKIHAAAKEFYLDKTKNFDERKKVFEKYGESIGSIYRPEDLDLGKIFDMYNENDNERHSIIGCLDIIEWWIEKVYCNKVELDYYNRYHPKIVKSKRKYTPSDEACIRLTRYYTEKLFLYGISQFTFDW